MYEYSQVRVVSHLLLQTGGGTALCFLPSPSLSLSIAGNRQALWRHGGPVSASQPRGVPFRQRGDPDGRTFIAETRVESLRRNRNVNEAPRQWKSLGAVRRVVCRKVPPRPPPIRSSAHTLGLTVFPEVPCCQVTLYPSATTARAFPG